MGTIRPYIVPKLHYRCSRLVGQTAPGQCWQALRSVELYLFTRSHLLQRNLRSDSSIL
jgi:hypothetical protein